MVSKGLALASLLLAACGQSAPPAPTATLDSTAPAVATSPTASASPAAAFSLVQFGDTTEVGAAAEQEMELTRQLREDTGMPALLGANGPDAFANLDAIADEFAQRLIAELAAAIDAGRIPDASGAAAGAIASIDGAPVMRDRSGSAIDISLFADTGFTASAIMSMFTQIVQQAAQDQSGTIPRQDSHDATSNGLRQQVDLSTSYVVQTGGGRVSLDIIMAATDRITNAATGSFVALYTSRSTAHFDVSACPDDAGVAEGTYTFETKHELNDVSTTEAARSAAARSVDAPFRLINGDDAHLVRIEATLDMNADGRGPGTPGGPGPTGPFDWGATQQLQIVMPVNGATSATGTGLSITGAGGERAGGAMLLSSAMAQLFMAQVGREAEAFWRKGECIEIKTSDDSRTVSAGEAVEFTVEALGKFDKRAVDAAITGSFSGVQSLEPANAPQSPPVTLTFKAGSQVDDKGTIQLEQVGRRGIGKKTVEFTVGASDYRIDNVLAGMGSFTTIKCDGRVGQWQIDVTGPNTVGSYVFNFAPGSDQASVHGDIVTDAGAATSHWVLDGQVTYVDGDPPELSFGTLTGTVTVKAMGQTQTHPTEAVPTRVELLVGDFCDS